MTGTLSQVSTEVATIDNDDNVVTVRLTAHLTMLPDGKYYIDALELDAQNGFLTPTMLRQIPLTGLVSSAIYRETRPTIAPLQGRPTPAALAHFADVYRAALVAGCKPVKVVCEEFGFKRPKAADWLKRARSAGLIAPGEEWRPKGRTDTETATPEPERVTVTLHVTQVTEGQPTRVTEDDIDHDPTE